MVAAIAWLLLLLCAVGTQSFLLVPAIRRQVCSTETQLNMGLRSFIKNRLGKPDSENRQPSSEEDDESFDLPPVPHKDDQENAVTKTAAIRQRKSSNPFPSSYGETIQERMRRIKTGGMTLEEKEAFLDRTLSWNEPKKFNKKTIRQSLPLGGVPVKVAKPDPTPSSTSGPGVTAETSWSHVVSTKRHEQRERYGIQNGAGGGVPLMDDAAKEAWLKMVTSPTRFQGYSAVQKNATASQPVETTLQLQPSQPVTQQQLRDLSNAKRRLAEQQKLFEEMAQGSNSSGEQLLESSPFLPRGAGSKFKDEDTKEDRVPADESEITSIPTDVVSETKKTDDLAKRLEQAAMLQEQRDREAREAMEEENRRIQMEEQRRLAERQRERQRVTEQQEAQRIQKRRDEEAKLLEAQKQKLDEDIKKRKQLEERQMEYWSQKLAQEQALKDKKNQDSSAGEAVKVPNEKERPTLKQIEMGSKSVARNAGGDAFIQSQVARKDALKRFTKDQQSHLSDLNSLKSNQLPRPLPVEPDTASRPGPKPAPTGISVGDLLNGRIQMDDQALDQFKDLDQEGNDMSEEEALKGIEQTLANFAAKRPPPQRPSKPIRQAIPDPSKTVIASTNQPQLPRVDVESRSSTSSDISDEDKKKANKWGINLDKLL